MLLVIGRVRCGAENRDELIALFEEMQGNSRRGEGLLERVSGAPEVAIHEVVDTKPFPRGDAA